MSSMEYLYIWLLKNGKIFLVCCFQDFFWKPAFSTVPCQLNEETYARALSDVTGLFFPSSPVFHNVF